MGHHRWRGRCVAPIPWDWDTMDVHVRRQVVLPKVLEHQLCSITEANITPEFLPTFPSQFDWGNTSDAAEHLALCVLDRFLPPKPGEQLTIHGQRHSCSHEAWELHLPYLMDVIQRVPFWGATLPGETIRQWIAVNKPAYLILPHSTPLTWRNQ